MDSIISYIEMQAKERASDIFITEVQQGNKPIELNYSDLNRYSKNCSAWLIEEFHVAESDTFCILPSNDINSVILIFGLLRLGCSILILNPNNPEERLLKQINSLRIKKTFKSRALSPEIMKDHSVIIPQFSEIRVKGVVEKNISINLSMEAIYFATSGSTAASKIVAQTHGNIVSNANATKIVHDLMPGVKILGCLPIYQANGLHFTIFATLFSGSHAILANNFDPFEYPKIIEFFKPDIASVVPSILEALIAVWREPKIPINFKYFVSAAAPLSKHTANRIMQKFGVKIHQAYGLTETTNFSTSIPCTISDKIYKKLVLQSDIPTIGCSIQGNDIVVLKKDGTIADYSEIGEICIKGSNVMSRYINNEKATRDAIREDWFHTGDLGFKLLDEETGTEFFFLTGRIKNIAKINGELVSLEEMERMLCSIPDIVDAACISFPKRYQGECIIAVVVPSEKNAISEMDIKKILKKMFSSSVLPEKIIYLSKIPRTPMGKVLRPQLQEELQQMLSL